MGVEILQICNIAPSNGSGSTQPCTLPLTFFDLLWYKLPISTERVYFYPCSTSSFLSTHLPNLKRSLSLALDLFHPLAGRLLPDTATDLPCISFSHGDSVQLTVAESDDDLQELTSGQPNAPARLRCLVPALPVSETSQPTVALQVTSFPGQGIAVGITALHAAMDGSSSCHFMRTWASICRSQAAEEPPTYDRSRILELVDVQSSLFTMIKQSRSVHQGSLVMRSLTDVVHATFELTAEQIESPRKWVETRASGGGRFSSFSLAVALVWTCLLKAGGGNESEIQGLIFPVDCRSRVDPPLPTSYFGNGVVGCLVEQEGSTLVGEEGLVVAATAIREGVRGFPVGADALRGLMESMVSRAQRMTAMNTLSVTGSPRLRVYDVDFGWGRPAMVEMASIANGCMSLSEIKTGTGGGLQIGFVLPAGTMREFTDLFHATVNSCSC